MDSVQEAKLRSALRLAARGFRVFPLHENSREPAIREWPKHATNDEAAIRRIWGSKPYNIGIAMGGGWLGFDIDMKNGKDGLASAKALGIEPAGFVARTPSGGIHVVYKAPADTQNSVGRLGEGLDTRSRGGFLVAPGSVVNGRAYEIISDNDPQPVPAVIIHRLVAPREKSDYQVDYEADSADYVARAIDFLLHAAKPAVQGARGDDTAFQTACRVKDLGVSQQTAHALMVEHYLPRCTFDFPTDAAADWVGLKVASAFRTGQNPEGSATPAADFAGVKVEPPPQPTRAPSRWFRHGDDFDKSASWLFYEMLPTTGVCLLIAPSQAGKTFLLLELARCGATGKSFFTVEPDDRFATLFVYSGTEGSGLATRMAALGEPGTMPISATQWDEPLNERGQLDALLGELRAEAERIELMHGVPVKLIVFETMATSGLVADENDAIQAGNAMKCLGALGRAMNALVVTTHHPSKDGKGQAGRGSTAFFNAADVVIEVERYEDRPVRTVKMAKARGAKQRRLGTFSLVPVELGQDTRGRMIRSMTVSMGDKDDRVPAGQMPKHADKLMEALNWALGEGDAERINGALAVEEGTLKEALKDRLAGTAYAAKTGNLNALYSKIIAWAEAVGRVECVAWAGGTWIIGRGVKIDAE